MKILHYLCSIINIIDYDQKIIILLDASPVNFLAVKNISEELEKMGSDD